LTKLYTKEMPYAEMPTLLTGPEIDRQLKDLHGWKREGKFITKTFEFEKFMDGIDFVGRVARVAEEEEHHPDIHIIYTTVTLSVQTHSEGGVTGWDLELAEAIEKTLAATKAAHHARRR